MSQDLRVQMNPAWSPRTGMAGAAMPVELTVWNHKDGLSVFSRQPQRCGSPSISLAAWFVVSSFSRWHRPWAKLYYLISFAQWCRQYGFCSNIWGCFVPFELVLLDSEERYLTPACFIHLYLSLSPPPCFWGPLPTSMSPASSFLPQCSLQKEVFT